MTNCDHPSSRSEKKMNLHVVKISTVRWMSGRCRFGMRSCTFLFYSQHVLFPKFWAFCWYRRNPLISILSLSTEIATSTTSTRKFAQVNQSAVLVDNCNKDNEKAVGKGSCKTKSWESAESDLLGWYSFDRCIYHYNHCIIFKTEGGSTPKQNGCRRGERNEGRWKLFHQRCRSGSFAGSSKQR